MERRWRTVTIEVDGRALSHSFMETEEALRICGEWLSEQLRLIIPVGNPGTQLQIRFNG